MKINNVLSLFDGKSSGFTALELAGIEFNEYFSSEVDPYAIKVSNSIHPNQKRLGDVTKWREWDIDWASIDLLIAGSPCQGFSFAGKQLAFDDPRSRLFFEFVDILNHIKSVNPNVKFMLENVKMKKEFIEVINDLLGEEGFLINSALVSAQNRQRLYWSNIPIDMPEDRGIVLADIIEHSVDQKYYLSEKILKGFQGKKERRKSLNSGFDNLNVCSEDGKASCITARYHKTSMSDPFIIQRPRGNNLGGVRAENGKTPALSSSSWEHNNFASLAGAVRRLTPKECFRLQTVPEKYIDKIINSGVSNTRLYQVAGNGWTDEVIAHIFTGLHDEDLFNG